MYGNGAGDVLGGNAVEWHCAWKTCWMFVKVERWEEIFVISASFDCDGGWAMRSGFGERLRFQGSILGMYFTVWERLELERSSSMDQ